MRFPSSPNFAPERVWHFAWCLRGSAVCSSPTQFNEWYRQVLPPLLNSRLSIPLPAETVGKRGETTLGPSTVCPQRVRAHRWASRLRARNSSGRFAQVPRPALSLKIGRNRNAGSPPVRRENLVWKLGIIAIFIFQVGDLPH